MKQTIITSLLLAACLWQGCGTGAQAPVTTAMTAVFDRTDSIRNFPNAQTLLSPLNLAQDKFQGIHIVLTTISDKDVNARTILDLKPENEWTGNVVERDDDIRRFVMQVQRALDSMRNMPACSHSIVYRAIAREANALAARRAGNKYLVVFSDLYEADDSINFYHKSVLQRIRQHPDTVAAQLEKSLPVQPLAGLKVWLLYDPKSFADNNAFMPVATMYQRMLERHGATVHVATQFAEP